MNAPRFHPTKTSKGWRLNIPSGVSASGKRARRFFATKEAAYGAAIKLRVQFENNGKASRILTPEQAQAAARAFGIIGLGRPAEDLIEAARHFVKSHDRRSASLPFEQAFERFVNSQTRSGSYAQSLRQYLARLKPLHGRVLCEISAADVDAAMHDFPPSVYNYGLRILGCLFNYAAKYDYCASNPIQRLDRRRISVREIEIYTPEEAAALLRAVEPALVPWLALCMFAGLRGAEGRRLYWRNINFDEHFVRVPSTISKTGQPRAIPLEANLRQWLWPHRAEDDQLVAPQGVNVIRKQLRAGHANSSVRQIKHGPRHSYCSYLLARDGSIDAVLLNAGHDNADTTFRHYASKIATKQAAAAFWAIRPTDGRTNVAQENVITMRDAA